MITCIAIDDEYIYTLDGGEISRQSIAGENSIENISPPPHVPSEIVTTNAELYALTDGGIYRRWSDGGSWNHIDAAVGITQISTSETGLYAVVDGVAYVRRFYDASFEIVRTSQLDLKNIVQLDHDEESSYCVTQTGGIYTRRYPHGEWSEYRPLSNVQQVVAGIEYIYAMKNDGRIYRSKTDGQSAWEGQGSARNMQYISVASDHSDLLWHTDGSNIYSSHGYGFDGYPEDRGWIIPDWIDSDWIEVGA